MGFATWVQRFGVKCLPQNPRHPRTSFDHDKVAESVEKEHVYFGYLRPIRCLLSFKALVGFVACEQTPAVTVNPSFEIAGVIEGFYGTPWSHEDRLDILEFMGQVGLNTYFYAPKADPYHLSRWKDAYPAREWEHLRQLKTTADANAVTFWYAISPGLTMQYSAQEDYDALLAKIDTVATLGVRHFGLFLDDVPLELSNTADVSQFQDLATAHIALINKLHADFATRGYELAVTPTVYTSAWDTPDYINRLGAEVHRDVYMIWTGPDVATSQVTHEHSEPWSNRLQRRVILWDNYPVNDFAPWRVFLGPLRGRDGRLPRSTIGILSNPMNQAHASMVPLFTLADYAADPQTYDADSSWQRGIQTLLGADAFETLRPFFEVFGGDAAATNILEPLHFLRDTIDLTSIANAVSDLENAIAKSEVLSPSTPAFRKTLDELAPIVARARARIQTLQNDSRYRLVDGLLVFDTDSEQFNVAFVEGTSIPDGDLSEWSDADWYTLEGPVDGEVSFAADDRLLRIALRVQTNVSMLEGSHIGEGTHIGLVLSQDRNTDEISSEDLFVLVAPRGEDTVDPHFVGAMKLDGFMAKWLADNENLTFTDFHITTLGDTVSNRMAEVARGLEFASKQSATGFTMEIHVPHRNQHPRFSLTVSSRVGSRMRSSSVARRNYPLNPNTFVTLRLPRLRSQ